MRERDPRLREDDEKRRGDDEKSRRDDVWKGDAEWILSPHCGSRMTGVWHLGGRDKPGGFRGRSPLDEGELEDGLDAQKRSSPTRG